MQQLTLKILKSFNFYYELSNSKINVNIPIIYSRFPRSEKTTDVIKIQLLLGIETKDIEIVKLLLSFDNLDINAKNIL